MAYKVIESLSKVDDKYFKNLLENRAIYIDSGDETLKSIDTSIKKVISRIRLDKEQVYIKNKEVLDNCTIITLANNSEVLSPFHPGQYIVISAYIAGNNYSRPYYLISDKNDFDNGEYKICVLKKEDSIMANYLRNSRINDILNISGPYGDFYYNSVRDCDNIIAICDDYGINPAYAMAKKIIKDKMKIKFNIIYNVTKYDDILYLDELNKLAESNNINLEIIINDEIVEGFKSGYVTLDVVKKYLDKENSIFIYSGEGMLKYLNRELEDLKLPRRYIRYENYLPRCNVKNAKKYELVIKCNDKEIKHSCYNNKTLLDSIEDSRIVIDSISRTGKDNLCNVRILNGKIKIVNDFRNESEKLLNIIDPSNSYPNSNTKIEIL